MEVCECDYVIEVLTCFPGKCGHCKKDIACKCDKPHIHPGESICYRCGYRVVKVA